MKFSAIGKPAIVGASILLFSFSTKSAIIEIGNINRDTATGLDWLDVTETRGLSYTDMVAQTNAGGVYEGWRHATAAELDTLISNFGYIPVNSNCSNGLVHCDYEVAESETIESIIRILGDTLDTFWDVSGDARDIDPNGAGYTFGALGENVTSPNSADSITLSLIADVQIVRRSDGEATRNDPDILHTGWTEFLKTSSDDAVGHFLVSSAAVPVPATAWLFASALGGLVLLRRKNPG